MTESDVQMIELGNERAISQGNLFAEDVIAFRFANEIGICHGKLAQKGFFGVKIQTGVLDEFCHGWEKAG